MNDSYLRLHIDGKTIRGEWNIDLYNLAITAGLNDKAKNSQHTLRGFALDHLLISADSGNCTLHIDKKSDNEPDDVISSYLSFEGECPLKINSLTIDYSPFLGIGLQHGALVYLATGQNDYTAALSAQNYSFTFQIGGADRWQQFGNYLHEGVWHIWLGYDHILFLFSLLLSAAFIVRDGEWQPREDFTGAFVQVLKIVTSFTIAHSITLSLVIFGAISLPSRLVESVIALSIAVAAANNLRPVLHQKLWLLTFGFGLIHGMGFANALQELGLPNSARWMALVAFNLGVEIGQVSIVVLILPVIYWMRRFAIYRRLILRIVSAQIIAVALLWFTQRAIAVTLLKGILGA